jgi:hypothetical protein
MDFQLDQTLHTSAPTNTQQIFECPSFKLVDINDQHNDQTMNLRSENLFEVYNAAEICKCLNMLKINSFYFLDDEHLTDPANSVSFNSSKVTVKSTILDDTCFICVDRTVHCFKIGSHADKSARFELEGKVLEKYMYQICV